jgi:hypothetical protein
MVWSENQHWRFATAALHGSSHDLPAAPRWFTANIGMTMSTNYASAKRGLPRTRHSQNFDMSSEPRLSRSATRPCTHADGCHLSAERGAAKLSFRVLGDGGPFAFCGAVSCPANASATTGFILSTIDVGIRIVAPRSLVVS